MTEYCNRNKNISLMTHIVAGYPDMETSLEIAIAMAEAGSDIIEIQIPFSDPLADGPVIMKANQVALDAGMTTGRAFELIKELTEMISIPVVVMTYINIPFAMGIEYFFDRISASGASGVIIPDLPFDSSLYKDYTEVKGSDIDSIYVVSPDMSTFRLRKAMSCSSGFVYTTLRIGITGANRGEISQKGIEFARTVKANTELPVAAGFGISNPQQFRSLEGVVDIGVIGSKLIDVYDVNGIQGVGNFVERCTEVTD